MAACILIIEDNPANLDLMVYLLKAHGYEPLTAMDGETGLTLAKSERPDLVICDIQLPRLSGFDVAKAMKSQPEMKRVPLVAVSAYAMVGDRDRILAAGFDGYLAKPIVPETFVEMVEKFIPATLRSAGLQPSPHADGAAEGADEGKAFQKSAVGGRILVVDNVVANLTVLKSILELFGFEVMTANSVREAISVMEVSRPHLILTDLHMPQESGIDLVHQVRSRPDLAGIPFAFISSTVENAREVREVEALGVCRFIHRPIEPQNLFVELEACLRAARLAHRKAG